MKNIFNLSCCFVPDSCRVYDLVSVSSGGRRVERSWIREHDDEFDISVCIRRDYFVGIRCCLVDSGVSRPSPVPRYLVVPEEFVKVVEENTLAGFASLDTLRLDAFVFDALA